MANIVVQKDIVIAQPIEVVRAQFRDMQHHEANHIHSTLHVSNVRPQAGGGCVFTGRRRMLGVMQEDEIQVTPRPDGVLTLRGIKGPNEGLQITQTFTPEGPERTRVTAVVSVPARGVMQWLAPLVRFGIERDVALALREDQADLERGAYAHRPVAA